MASAAASGLDLDLSEKEVENPVVVTRAAWVENAQRPSLRREGETQHQSEDSKEEKRPAPRGHGCCTGRDNLGIITDEMHAQENDEALNFDNNKLSTEKS
ncbi:hypothetical protein OPV22_028400 [Ensete ventricosum]|uniref:Uncharacterized protein n=1 Tax=Ensete ventricosum TaxID=4639 RepID=A0AAV8PY58_ENSVE|nr:hypothetical protein OPV22_028400 [Ensete ventricosum]